MHKHDDFAKLIMDTMTDAAYVPCRSRELARRLKIDDASYPDFRNTLRELQRQEKLVKRKGGRWGLPGAVRKPMLQGTLHLTRSGCGFLIPDDPAQDDLYIPEEELGSALHGDKVLASVEPTRGRSLRRSGSIEEIVERGSPRIVAIITDDQKARPEDEKNPYDYTLAPDSKQAKPDEKVLLEILVWPGEGGEPSGRVLEILGPAGAPDTETAAILAKYDAPGPFSAEVKEAVRQCPFEISEDERARRLDLTDLITMTIDPVDARDYDDALSLEEREDGTLVVGVHIADVSHFVRPGEVLDEEARERSTSIYIPGRVIPMLPEELSNDLCSLRPNEDHLTKTVFLQYDRAGNRLGYTIHRSIIHSKRRFAYREILPWITTEEPPADEDPQIVKRVRGLHALAQELRETRLQKGSLELALPEMKVLLDEDGNAVDIVDVPHDVSHQLVEEFMLAANQAVAEWCCSNGLGVLHRVHAAPSEEDVEELSLFLTASGYPFKAPFDRRRINAILEAASGKPEEHAVSLAVLKSFKKAVYGPDATIGHFALNFRHYLHFTSPIRRYPDLFLHQALESVFAENAHKLPKKLHRAAPPPRCGLESLGMHTSQRERRAMEIEEEIKDFRRLELLEKSGQREFVAVITGIQKFGIFVEIRDYFVESLLPRTMVEAKGFSCREEVPGAQKRIRHGMRRFGHRHKPGFHLGQLVRVEITDIDLPARLCQMEFLGLAKKTD